MHVLRVVSGMSASRKIPVARAGGDRG